MNTRAKAGGQIGINGEWYDGGEFLPSSPKTTKGEAKKATNGSGKRQIAPFVWEIPPEGMRSIYQKYSQVWKMTSGKMEVFRGLNREYYGEKFLAEAQEMAERWNRGERWMPD